MRHDIKPRGDRGTNSNNKITSKQSKQILVKNNNVIESDWLVA